MERHYTVWTAFALMVFGLIALYHIFKWYFRYTERVKANNPAKAAFVSFLFCTSWVTVFFVIRAYFPEEESLISLQNALREILLAGIVGMGLFSLLYGGIYIAFLVAKKLDSAPKPIEME